MLQAAVFLTCLSGFLHSLFPAVPDFNMERLGTDSIGGTHFGVWVNIWGLGPEEGSTELRHLPSMGKHRADDWTKVRGCYFPKGGRREGGLKGLTS